MVGIIKEKVKVLEGKRVELAQELSTEHGMREYIQAMTDYLEELEERVALLEKKP